MSIEGIIQMFLWFQLGNWFSYFVLKTSIETSIGSLFFTGIFTIALCLAIIFKGY